MILCAIIVGLLMYLGKVFITVCSAATSYYFLQGQYSNKVGDSAYICVFLSTVRDMSS